MHNASIVVNGVPELVPDVGMSVPSPRGSGMGGWLGHTSPLVPRGSVLTVFVTVVAFYSENRSSSDEEETAPPPSPSGASSLTLRLPMSAG